MDIGIWSSLFTSVQVYMTFGTTDNEQFFFESGKTKLKSLRNFFQTMVHVLISSPQDLDSPVPLKDLFPIWTLSSPCSVFISHYENSLLVCHIVLIIIFLYVCFLCCPRQYNMYTVDRLPVCPVTFLIDKYRMLLCRNSKHDRLIDPYNQIDVLDPTVNKSKVKVTGGQCD